jgi:hypothetical protein
MPSLSSATQPMDTTDLKAVPPTAPSSAVSNPSADPEFSPISLAPIPSVMGTDTDAARQFYRSAVSQLRMPPLPAAAKIAIGASAASQAIAAQVSSGSILLKTNNVNNPAQDILNITGSGVSYGPNPGEVQIVTGGGDGLVHGQPTVADGSWESDPAYVSMRDDFLNGGTAVSASNSIANIGNYNWLIAGAIGGNFYGMVGGAPPNMGNIGWDNNTSAQNAGWLLLPSGNPCLTSFSGGAHTANSWALVENPAWAMSWVFQLNTIQANNSTNYSFTHKSLYVGLVGPHYGAEYALPQSRPDVFLGVRYDTSVSPGTLTVSGVTSGSGHTTYTGSGGSWAAGANGAWVGKTFTTSGFSHSNNDVTNAVCSASSSGSITLVNASGGTSTDSGTATGAAGPTDSFFTFEAVTNGSGSSPFRNNLQGNTSVTTIAPAIGVYYRLDIVCTTAGQVTMTLSNGTTSVSAILTVPKATITGTAGQMSGAIGSGLDLGYTDWTATLSPQGYAPWATGSVVTISGYTSTQAGLNGTWTLSQNDSGTDLLWYSSATVSGGSSGTVSITGYPSYVPAIVFGNDDNGTSFTNNMGISVDFFSFIWNPGVGGGTGTPLVANPRFFTS